MNTIPITDIKKFMAILLTKETFDNFLFQEASVTTYNTFRIDGHIQKDFYTKEEYDTLLNPDLSTWGNIRPFCYDIIKGKKTPLHFQIILRFNPSDTEALLQREELSFSLSDIFGLYLNIIFENGKLHCITGTSMKLFTLDKSLEKSWDKEMDKIISTHLL